MTCRRTSPTMVERSRKRRRAIHLPSIPREPRWAAREGLEAREFELVDLPSKGGWPGKRMKLQIRGDPSPGDIAARQAAVASLPRGLVGLRNQKSNCYANSIVQMLYLCRLYATLLLHIFIFLIYWYVIRRALILIRYNVYICFTRVTFILILPYRDICIHSSQACIT